jgi:hypothetical protein
MVGCVAAARGPEVLDSGDLVSELVESVTAEHPQGNGLEGCSRSRRHRAKGAEKTGVDGNPRDAWIGYTGQQVSERIADGGGTDHTSMNGIADIGAMHDLKPRRLTSEAEDGHGQAETIVPVSPSRH